MPHEVRSNRSAVGARRSRLSRCLLFGIEEEFVPTSLRVCIAVVVLIGSVVGCSNPPAASQPVGGSQAPSASQVAGSSGAPTTSQAPDYLTMSQDQLAAEAKSGREMIFSARWGAESW